MRIKGHEIPARKGLLTAASAAVVVVAISAFGRIALRTDLAHSQTSAEKYPSCGSVAVCINGGVNSQFYFGGIVSPKCIQTNGGERNKVGVGSCVSPSSTSMVAQTINAPNNNGIITQGQTGGSNTIIQAPVARHLNDGLKDQLLAHISKDRKVSVTFASTATLPQARKKLEKIAGGKVEIAICGRFYPSPPPASRFCIGWYDHGGGARSCD